MAPCPARLGAPSDQYQFGCRQPCAIHAPGHSGVDGGLCCAPGTALARTRFEPGGSRNAFMRMSFVCWTICRCTRAGATLHGSATCAPLPRAGVACPLHPLDQPSRTWPGRLLLDRSPGRIVQFCEIVWVISVERVTPQLECDGGTDFRRPHLITTFLRAHESDTLELRLRSSPTTANGKELTRSSSSSSGPARRRE